MVRHIEAFVIRWAVRRLDAIILANPNMSYGQLGRYGVADYSTNDFGERSYIFDR